MTCKIFPDIKRRLGQFVSAPKFTLFFRKTGAVFLFTVLVWGFLFSGFKGLAVAEEEGGVVSAKTIPPKTIFFSDYAKMSKEERGEVIKDTLANLYGKLRYKGQNLRAQCLLDIYSNLDEPEPFYKLIAEMEAKAEIEEEMPETKYKKTVPWHIARRILETCPPEQNTVAR